MTTSLEFLDNIGSESVAAPIEQYDGPVPAVGDMIYLDLTERFRIVRRIFSYLPERPRDLTAFRPEMKVSLHCERLPDGKFY